MLNKTPDNPNNTISKNPKKKTKKAFKTKGVKATQSIEIPSFIDQFKINNFELLEVSNQEKSTCHSCKNEFVSGDKYHSTGRILKRLNKRNLNLCPVCCSCLTRFTISSQILEKKSNSNEFSSFVTVHPSSIIDRKSILKTAFIIAVLSHQTEEIKHVIISDDDGEYRIGKEDLKPQLAKMKEAYNSMTVSLAEMVVKSKEKMSLDDLQNNKTHSDLGNALKSAITDISQLKGSVFEPVLKDEILTKIAVMPSLDYIASLLDNVFVVKEVERNCKMQVTRSE